MLAMAGSNCGTLRSYASLIISIYSHTPFPPPVLSFTMRFGSFECADGAGFNGFKWLFVFDSEPFILFSSDESFSSLLFSLSPVISLQIHM